MTTKKTQKKAASPAKKATKAKPTKKAAKPAKKAAKAAAKAPAKKAAASQKKTKRVSKPAVKKASPKAAVAKPAAKTPTAKPAVFSDKTTYAPFSLFEYEHPPAGRYCLLLSDLHMVNVMGLFEEAGREGHGYDWESICKHLLSGLPAIKKQIKTDPEAGMFVAYGTDLAALQQLAALMHAAFHDEIQLAALIKAVPDSLWD